jgi:phosphoribosylformylglycinamidine cyclo-ligase
LASEGGVPQGDYERTWNCGIGMVAVVAPDQGDLTLKALSARGMKAWVAGRVEKGATGSTLEGSYQNR